MLAGMSALPPLVSADELAAVLGAPNLVVLDATTKLTVTGEGVAYTVTPDRDGFVAARVPGARFVDVQGDLSDPAGRFAFALPTPEAFGDAMGRLGVGDGTHVVAYDTGRTAWATRVWWLLRTFGHDAVSVLDVDRMYLNVGAIFLEPVEDGAAASFANREPFALVVPGLTRTPWPGVGWCWRSRRSPG